MYKVFINEKKITISKSPNLADKNITFDGSQSIEAALTLINHPEVAFINIYGEDLAEVWEEFSSKMNVIEAAGGIVFNKNQELLFIHRLGKWDLPKGKLETQEHLRDAAIREVQEETGLKELVIERFINNTFHIYEDEKRGQKVLKITYWFLMNYTGTETPIPQEEEGITQVKWMGEQEMEETVYNNTFQNIRLILDEVFAEKND